MAEAMLRHLAGHRFEALSAGARPAGYIHPLAIETLRHLEIDSVGLRSKGVSEISGGPVDAVITLCDSLEKSGCPTLPGAPISAHWPLPDPAAHMGPTQDCFDMAIRVAARLQAKLEGLINLDWSGPPEKIQASLRTLGDI